MNPIGIRPNTWNTCNRENKPALEFPGCAVSHTFHINCCFVVVPSSQKPVVQQGPARALLHSRLYLNGGLPMQISHPVELDSHPSALPTDDMAALVWEQRQILSSRSKCINGPGTRAFSNRKRRSTQLPLPPTDLFPRPAHSTAV